MSDASNITSLALANVQGPIGIKMLKKAMDIQENVTLQLIQSVTQNTQQLEQQGIGRRVNSLG